MPKPLDRVKAWFMPAPGEPAGLFQASATIISVAAIYLYFAGYVYCYGFYFRYYQVSLDSLDLSPQFYMMRSFSALDNGLGVSLVVVLLAVVFGYLHGKLPTWITVAVMVAAFPVLFHISYETAMKSAQRNICLPSNSIVLHFKDSDEKEPGAQEPAAHAKGRQPVEQDPLTVSVQTTGGSASQSQATPSQTGSLDQLLGDDDSASIKDVAALGRQGELALLLETKDRIVVIHKPACDFGKNPPALNFPGHVYNVSRSDLDFTNITLQ